jgi:hypothetical protein
LAYRRGDIATARTILEAGVARGLAPAMRDFAWMELKLARRDEARALYRQAIDLGDFPARMLFARAIALGRFGLREVPEGIRSVFAAAHDFSAQVDARIGARSGVSKLKAEPPVPHRRLWAWR